MKTNLTVLIFLVLILSACAQPLENNTPDTPSPAATIPKASRQPAVTTETTQGAIGSVSSSAMRLLPVAVDLASAGKIDIPLPGEPVWVAGIPQEGGSAWAVAFEDGNLMAFSVSSTGYESLAISPEELPPGSPLTLYSQDGQFFALTAPGTDASHLTPPVLIDPALPKIAYITSNGELVIWDAQQEIRLSVNALPDSRILVDVNGRLLFLSHPSDRYTHGVLGDKLEGTGITLVETDPEPRVLRTISIPEPDVIEGIYPTWTDMNMDGQLEIIVTLSNVQDGARVVAFREDGSLLAEGPVLGAGYRWRHQLLAAPFGTPGENLLAVVRTPHIGGVLEFYRLNANKLEIVSTVNGVSTHSIGSRNLFTAQAGDFDNDGRIELLAPDQNHTRLGIVSMDSESIAWINLDAELVTNLAAVASIDTEGVFLAGGLSNNLLRIWLP